MIPPALRKLVFERAGGCCEYCGLQQSHSAFSFHVEHVIPRQHGGTSTIENLALACPNCNLHKGPNLTGIDPDTGEICRRYHPRELAWNDHFGAKLHRITGKTATGRTTVWLLAMNDDEQVRLRSDA